MEGAVSVQGKKTEFIDVEISHHVILQEAIKIVKSNAGINRFDLEKRKGVECLVEYEWHYHGSPTVHMIREATPEDLRAFEVVSYLTDLLRSK